MAMRGRIERCWLFSYRCAPAEVERFLPTAFEPLIFSKSAFWNVLVCRVGSMRPHFFPAALGLSYWHVAYRIPVVFRTTDTIFEGLYFVRSDCSSGLLSAGGNLLTDFHFHQAQFEVREEERVRIRIVSAAASATIELGREPPPALEQGSPFSSLAAADQFLKYKPAALAIQPDGQVQILRIGRDENAWRNRLVQVKKAEWAFLKGKNATLEICQEVEPIEYLWNRGETVEA